MLIRSFNEWDTLRSVVIGTATGANWPSEDPVFAQESQHTLWKDFAVPSGPVPQWIIDEANEDLEGLVRIIEQFGAEVIRPSERDFVRTKGMYNYCPRDRLIVAGTQLIDTAMLYPCRDQEIECLQSITDDNIVRRMPRNQGMILDAANVCRLNDTWLFLQSRSGNRAAADWLEDILDNEVSIEICNFYAGVHIDSTIVPLREGLVVLNASRVNENNCPKIFEKWQKIWVSEVREQSFYQYPYASKWIALNMLSLDPCTVIMDAAQTGLRKNLESFGITVIPHALRHSRTLGGGFHCVSLDLFRG
jgi:scyllo-inosamine-4-phosphate amidinotransferase 1